MGLLLRLWVATLKWKQKTGGPRPDPKPQDRPSSSCSWERQPGTQLAPVLSGCWDQTWGSREGGWERSAREEVGVTMQPSLLGGRDGRGWGGSQEGRQELDLEVVLKDPRERAEETGEPGF